MCLPPECQVLVLSDDVYDSMTDPNVPPTPEDLHSGIVLKILQYTNPDYLRSLEEERKQYFHLNYGKSHSNPDKEYIDINKPAQHFVARWCSTVLRFCTTVKISPTLTMKNLSLEE